MKTLPYFGLLGAAVALVLLGASCTQMVQPNVPSAPVVDTTSTVLNLSNSGLTEFPKYILSMTQLVELNLSYNQLTGALPAQIRALKNLQKLDLSYNNMSGVPAEIGELSQLQELNLSHNHFTGLPNEIGNLTNLKVLTLTGNNYSAEDVKGIQAKLPVLKIIK